MIPSVRMSEWKPSPPPANWFAGGFFLHILPQLGPAIHFLVDMGILECVKVDGSCYYRVNQKKLFEIDATLEQLRYRSSTESPQQQTS